jgi:hypothetical protein
LIIVLLSNLQRMFCHQRVIEAVGYIQVKYVEKKRLDDDGDSDDDNFLNGQPQIGDKYHLN